MTSRYTKSGHWPECRVPQNAGLQESIADEFTYDRIRRGWAAPDESGNIGQNVELDQNARIIWKQGELTYNGLQTVKIWAASAKTSNSVGPNCENYAKLRRVYP